MTMSTRSATPAARTRAVASANCSLLIVRPVTLTPGGPRVAILIAHAPHPHPISNTRSFGWRSSLAIIASILAYCAASKHSSIATWSSAWSIPCSAFPTVH